MRALALPPRPNSLVSALSELAARHRVRLDIALEAGAPAIIRDAVKKDNKLSAYVMGVVNSPAFKMGLADKTTTERRAADTVPQQQQR